MNIRRLFTVVLAMVALCAQPAEQPRSLRVSENKRFLVDSANKPFFWLGDTAWELFHRLNREDASFYLETRAKQGFTVVQAVALAEVNGLQDPNVYGHRPLIDNDPTKPDVKEGDQNDYWDHVDYIVERANQHGIHVGFLPTWGDKWNKKWGAGPEIFTPENARIYGRWLGNRYTDKDIIWILGGDRPVENDRHKEIIRSMARGLREGDRGRHLITFHPTGGSGSAQYFHGEDWLDFNMRQNGHGTEFTGRYEHTRTDYNRTPRKPVLDGEPLYEDHPINFKAPEFGHSVAADVRRALYWDLFGGACGHTYGNHAIWQMWTPDRAPINDPLMPWKQALVQPGAEQMQHAKRLLLSRPFLTRVPDDSIIVSDRVATSVPGAGRYHFCATRDSDGTYAMIYAPVGRSFTVRLDVIKGSRIQAWWFNPRDGKATGLQTFENKGTREFMTPAPGESLDWVLVLDDAERGYGLLVES